jgi:hypothetical protein
MTSAPSCRRWGGDWLGQVQGSGMPREMGPVVQDRLRYGLKTGGGVDSRPTVPAWRCSDGGRMRAVGFMAH